jgi:hypothetical protein
MRGALIAWVVVAGCTIAGCAARAPGSERPVRATDTAPKSPPPPGNGQLEPPDGRAAEDSEPDPGETIDDGVESTTVTEGERRTHPLDGFTAAQLEDRLLHAPDKLGSISWGQPGAGALLNGVQMPAGPHHRLTDPSHAWGTQETVDALLRCLAEVAEHFPSSAEPYVGHLSAKHGGPLNPHVSHQSGRDADVGYYFTSPRPPFARATPESLDLARTWAFVRALIAETDVELILIDQSLQRPLRDYARSHGDDDAWLATLFDRNPGRTRPLIIHARGHITHLHVRFASPVARETARRVGPLLASHQMVEEPRRIVTHLARSGDTLALLARRYSTTVASIMQANGLRSTHIRAGKVYRIPVPTRATRPPRPVLVEKRRLPPSG